MGGMDKMNRLTRLLNEVLKMYPHYSHGAIEDPKIQEYLGKIKKLLSKNRQWEKDVEDAETWL